MYEKNSNDLLTEIGLKLFTIKHILQLLMYFLSCMKISIEFVRSLPYIYFQSCDFKKKII